MKTIVNRYIKLKRNEVCPCDENMALDEGKRKKFKKCCGIKLAGKEQQAKVAVNEMKLLKEMKNEAISRYKNKIDHPLILPDNYDERGNQKKEIIIP